MTKVSSALVSGLVAAAGCLGIAACGSSSDSGSSSGGKTGGTARIGSVLPDNYDPVILQTNQANQALQLVYTGLVTYRHVEGSEGAEIVPGLAEKLPTISADKKTYTFKLRPGIKYSDGSRVKASDFEHTIKRLLFLGGPFSSFSSGIVGAAKYQADKKASADIPGITADAKTGVITVKLAAPDSKFLYAMGLPSAAPEPAAKAPFKVTQNPPIPGAGPFTIHITNPTRQFELTKNPNFDVPDIPKPKIDKFIVVKESVPKMTQDVIDGKLDFMTEDPAGDLLPQVKAKYASRFRLDPNPPNTYWFFLNETTKPFDKLEVRQAVAYAVDRTALQRIFGGRLSPSCNFLPPAYSNTGYKKYDPCPYGDPTQKPTAANIAKAKDLVAKSGYKGMSVTVWGNTKDPRPAIVDYLRDVMNEIGFKAKTKILDQQVYFATIGDKKTGAQAGFTDWFQDFPHPGDFFEPNLSAKALASSPTFNFQFKSNPKVDQIIKTATPEDPTKVADQWAAADKAVVDNVNAVIYGNELASTFMSTRMDFQNCPGVHPLYKNDWLQFCMK
ncbi:MAG: peptide/nickel transport system substrate-binding protein [Solirubrobacteraceae bacterium]|jgi:peptide/nickel transport system substrate-binding protein|nr:peptide/nickel transport system substrate-binding protein [Solirubrobacteraceae bacterium]